MARSSILKKGKRGLSAVVITIILVAISLAAVVLVWSFVSNLIKNQIKSSESCFGTFGKFTINGEYTCYEELGPNDFKLRLSLVMADVKPDQLLVSISSGAAVKSFEITNTPQHIDNVVMYSGPVPENVSLPDKNAGLTYNITGFKAPIDVIKIAPKINGNLCDVSDSVSEVENCAMLAG